MRYLLLALVVGCATPGTVQPTDAAVPGDGGPRVCGLPARLTLSSGSAWSDCTGDIGASLTLDDAGRVAIVATGATSVSAVATSCTSTLPAESADGSCAWVLSIHCTGSDGDTIDINGSVSGRGPWTVSPLTVEFQAGGESCSGTAETASLREPL